MADENEQDGFGLDKPARIAYERQRILERLTPPRLEPDFPWTASPAFDPEFFELPANPRTDP